MKMKKLSTLCKALPWLSASLLVATMAACGGDDAVNPSPPPTGSGAGTGYGGLGRGPAPVDLGAAVNFVVLAESAITNVPTSVITGDVGLSPATGAGIGLTCAQVSGVIYDVNNTGPLPCTVVDPVRLTAAIGSKSIAYLDANSRAPDYTELGAGNIGGLTLGPATYKWGTGLVIPTNVTLSGGPNDVWIFQIAQGLTVSSGVQIILAGGALPKNVFWATFAAADIGTTSKFKGVIISKTSITMKTGATTDGRLLAGTAINFDHNVATQPAP
jgi:Ice-binding-like